MPEIFSSVLFDSDFYARTNPDVVHSDFSPLTHYGRYGAHEGRAPHILFSPQFYMAQLSQQERIRVREPIVHYIRHGARQGVSPSPFFDVKHYLRQVPRAAIRNLTPLEHYVLLGWKQGVSPSPDFDPEFYGDVAGIDLAQTDPLLHFLKEGWIQGHRPSSDMSALLFVFKHTRFGMYEINAPSQFLPPRFCGRRSSRKSRLLFMHIPKTAGVSLREVVKSQYRVGQAAYLHPFVASLPNMAEDLLRELSDTRESLEVIYGHFGYGLHALFQTPSKYVTFLRNPIDRIVSLYLFHATSPESPAFRSIQEGMTFEEYLDSDLTAQVNNGMARYICGLPVERHDPERPEPRVSDLSLLGLAEENIRQDFCFVGSMDRLAGSVQNLSRHLKWSTFRLPTLNVSDRSRPLKVTTRVKRRILDLNEIDWRLYEKFKEADYLGDLS